MSDFNDSGSDVSGSDFDGADSDGDDWDELERKAAKCDFSHFISLTHAHHDRTADKKKVEAGTKDDSDDDRPKKKGPVKKGPPTNGKKSNGGKSRR